LAQDNPNRLWQESTPHAPDRVLSCANWILWIVRPLRSRMETRHAVLSLVTVISLVMGVRAVVAGVNGDVGTVGRQLAVGGIVLGFGVALYRNWEAVGAG